MTDLLTTGRIGEQICNGLTCEYCIRAVCPFDSYEDQVPTYNEEDIGPEGL